MRNSVSNSAAAICAIMAISGATAARSATILDLDVGSLRIGSTNGFVYNEVSDSSGVIRPEMFFLGGASSAVLDGDPLDPSRSVDYVLNYHFTVAGTGFVMQTPGTGTYVAPDYVTNAHLSLSDGSTILSSAIYVASVPVNPGVPYTLSLSFHYNGGSLNLEPSTALQFAAVGLDVTPRASVVPEPATWAMLVGGFGLAGGAMRRRRRTVAQT